MAIVKPGSRLKSTVCDTEAIVVRAPADEITITCGGAPMSAPGQGGTERGSMSPELAGGSAVGKRYVSSDGALEVLCTRAGAGTLGVGDEPLSLLEAKPLPSSD
jgi:hypothetical protein